MDKSRVTKKAKTANIQSDSTQKVNGKNKNDLTRYFQPVSKNSISADKTEENKDADENEQSRNSNTSNESEKRKEADSEDAKESYRQNNFDKKQFIKQKFLVEMPDDFYLFYEFCKSLNPKNPLQAFGDVDLLLVGPFDVLADKFTNIEGKTPEEYLIHWRYYYDPPEFQTVLKGDDKRGYHIGYFRDSPEETPVFLASNCAEINGTLNVMGNNIFAAVQ